MHWLLIAVWNAATESPIDNGDFQRTGCYLRGGGLRHVGDGIQGGASGVNVVEICGYLLGAWGVGFAMGHIMKFFRRLVEMG